MQTFVPSPVCQYPFEDGDPIQGQHIRGAVSQREHTADSKFQEWNTGNTVDQTDNSPGISADFSHMPRPVIQTPRYLKDFTLSTAFPQISIGVNGTMGCFFLEIIMYLHFAALRFREAEEVQSHNELTSF